MDAKVKSLEKALNILECFTLENPELGVTEISRILDLNKSNVHNIVSTFHKNEYLVQNLENGKYRLGNKFMKLSLVVSTTMGFHRIMHRSINELATSIDEIVYFGIPDKNNVLYIEGAFPEKYYNVRLVQGMTAPLVCTAIGKAMLAHMKQDFIEEILKEPLIAYTDYTITNLDNMRAELLITKKRGYSTDNMEHEYGVKCVAVPVFDHNNKLVGAFSATGPSLRFNEEQSLKFVNLLKEKADQVKISI